MSWPVKFLVSIALLAAFIDCKHCIELGKDTWRHGGGSFERDGSNWIEYDNDMQRKATFAQTLDNGRQVLLADHDRGVSIVLQDGVAGINHNGGSQYEQLYKGSWAQGYDCT
mmetsp:Transcript_81864/g.136851  ORF Transcript_81864/g.136851 Transcript_81864/m.136851 type:complete len:112 (-) Transcript_81864:742-1077(-)|eukprot:CAMPEP_0174329938 /NCGR_PEP_ID=MMETSP0810-20121108/16258_1 /TAXON_ID=73025 ORGANISM="Eutreptiella gymnastica-like, Strain CCMP1594" /NCGR_SAMPLE_ID=MMETSP0810 /ASSEMBLY_ACC=CAM_ASM_000659 /LENGTH=111 /DNA_ID=CAMNT_0015444767 /DNA_START=21 /DNA_END=356 /DNA_ORIENTATION=+